LRHPPTEPLFEEEIRPPRLAWGGGIFLSAYEGQGKRQDVLDATAGVGMLIGCKMLCYPSVRSPLGSLAGRGRGYVDHDRAGRPSFGVDEPPLRPAPVDGLDQFQSATPNPQLLAIWTLWGSRVARAVWTLWGNPPGIYPPKTLDCLGNAVGLCRYTSN